MKEMWKKILTGAAVLLVLALVVTGLVFRKHRYSLVFSPKSVESVTVYAMGTDGAERKVLTGREDINRAAGLFNGLWVKKDLERGQGGTEGASYNFVFRLKTGREFRAMWYLSATGGRMADSARRMEVGFVDLHQFWDSLDLPADRLTYDEAVAEVVLPQYKAGVSVDIAKEDLPRVLQLLQSNLEKESS